MNEKTTTSVDLLTYDHRNVEYGAGLAHLRSGDAPFFGIEVTAHDRRTGEREKWVTTEDAAHKWLTQRGLPYAVATELIAAVTRSVETINFTDVESAIYCDRDRLTYKKELPPSKVTDRLQRLKFHSIRSRSALRAAKSLKGL